jgi:hypothetical protein
MVESNLSLHEPALDFERTKSHRINILRKIRYRKSPHRESESRFSFSQTDSPQSSSLSLELLPIYGIRGKVPDAVISEQFASLRDVIVSHVQKFYSAKPVNASISQALVEHASTGITLPWPQIISLLGESRTRLATLALCISWTILSRSLLLKLGISNSPGSTFLPPELVECFQSFSLGKGAVTLGKDEPSSVNFALLSRWKQISATLLHSTYVGNAFTHFDSRTVNIERALQDLDPLLTAYALPHNVGHATDARLVDLRDVLRQGAKFAFTLFSQPSFWKFDWKSDRAIAHGKAECQHDPETFFDKNGEGATEPAKLTAAEIVLWPKLLRVMDGEGAKTQDTGDECPFGDKGYLNDFET